MKERSTQPKYNRQKTHSKREKTNKKHNNSNNNKNRRTFNTKKRETDKGKYKKSYKKKQHQDSSQKKQKLAYLSKLPENMTHVNATMLGYVVNDVKECKHLSLINKNIEEISDISHLFGIEKVELQKNSISTIKNTFIQDIKSIKYINLSSNQLTDVTAICELPKLEIVNVSNNQLTTLSFPIQKNLKAIVANNNKLTTIPHIHHEQPLCNTLILSHNEIDNLGHKANLSKLPNLVRLRLNHNRIRTIEFEKLFKYQAKLNVVDLSYNKIFTLESASALTDLLPSLEHLNLNFNQIVNVKSLQCISQLKLKSIDIFGNPLSSMDEAEDYLKQILPTIKKINGTNNKPAVTKKHQHKKQKRKRPTKEEDPNHKPPKKIRLNRRAPREEEPKMDHMETTKVNGMEVEIHRFTSKKDQFGKGKDAGYQSLSGGKDKKLVSEEGGSTNVISASGIAWKGDSKTKKEATDIPDDVANTLLYRQEEAEAW